MKRTNNVALGKFDPPSKFEFQLFWYITTFEDQIILKPLLKEALELTCTE